METKRSKSFDSNYTKGGEKEDELLSQDFIDKLEQQASWDGRPLVRYGGFLLPLMCFRPIIRCLDHFKPKDEDIIVATLPKSGTTWLKALTFAIAKRSTHNPFFEEEPTHHHHPLLSHNPHQLVPFLEYRVYAKEDEIPDLGQDPTVYGTHIPYSVLSDPILESGCKIIYLCRNPLDQFVSNHHFSPQNNFQRADGYAEPLGLSESFEMFCSGVHHYGPFWDHMLGYWNAHVENPDKVLFLKYEDLKEDVVLCVRRIADFIGLSFSPEEEERGMAEQISRLCSFEKLSSFEVNKNGGSQLVKFSTFFRKGEVGDWKNHLTREMGERVEKIMETKFGNSGLSFRLEDA